MALDSRVTALGLATADFVAFNDQDIDAIVNSNGAVIFTTTKLEAIINTIAEFVFANAPANAEEDLLKAVLKQLVSDEFNNRLFKRGLMANWTPVVIMDKTYLMEILAESDEETDPDEQMFIETNVTEW